MKYLSIDIETTGLDIPSCQILQIAAVMDDDTSQPLDDMEHFNALVRADLYTGEAYSLCMNHKILDSLATQYSRCGIHYGHMVGIGDITNILERFKDWLYTFDGGKFLVAGKNASGFDIPFLKKYDKGLPFDHRVLDVGCLYMTPKDVYVPSLSECLSRAGLDNTVTHDALEDAYQVCRLVRKWEEGI